MHICRLRSGTVVAGLAATKDGNAVAGLFAGSSRYLMGGKELLHYGGQPFSLQ